MIFFNWNNSYNFYKICQRLQSFQKTMYYFSGIIKKLRALPAHIKHTTTICLTFSSSKLNIKNEFSCLATGMLANSLPIPSLSVAEFYLYWLSINYEKHFMKNDKYTQNCVLVTTDNHFNSVVFFSHVSYHHSQTISGNSNLKSDYIHCHVFSILTHSLTKQPTLKRLIYIFKMFWTN